MPASATRIVLRVDPATAKAYKEASPEDQERARSAFALSLRGKQEAADDLLRLMDEIAGEARERGLTPETLEEILNENPSSDGEPQPAGEGA